MCYLLSEILCRYCRTVFKHFLRRSRKHNFSAFCSPVGTDVDDVIREFHNIGVVFNHDNRVPPVNKAFENVNNLFDIRRVKSRRRLV